MGVSLRRSWRLGVLLAALVAITAASLTATAAVPQPTGVRVPMLGGDPTATRWVNESQPFHVKHGWICNATPLYLDGQGNWAPGVGTRECRNSDFRLFVNGKRTSDFVSEEYFGSGADRVLAARWNLTNFGSGLAAGTYGFRYEFWKNGTLTMSATRDVVVCPSSSPTPQPPWYACGSTVN